MSQFILLQSYVGCSDYFYDVTCSGHRLEIAEIKQRNLVDDRTLRRHKQSSYSCEWFEVNPGDWIEIRIIGEDYGEANMHVQFTIPDKGLDNPPQSLDDERTCILASP